MIMAAPIAWITRNPIRASSLGDKPQQTLATVKTANPTRYTRLKDSTSPRRPNGRSRLPTTSK